MEANREHEASDVELSDEESSGGESEVSQDTDTESDTPEGCPIPTDELSVSQNTIDWMITVNEHRRFEEAKKEKEAIIELQQEAERQRLEGEIYRLKTQKLDILIGLYELGAEGSYEALRAELDAAKLERESLPKEMCERIEREARAAKERPVANSTDRTL